MVYSRVAGKVDFGVRKCEEGGLKEDYTSQRPLQSEQSDSVHLDFHAVAPRLRDFPGLVSRSRWLALESSSRP